jgi:hypothetical protein
MFVDRREYIVREALATAQLSNPNVTIKMIEYRFDDATIRAEWMVEELVNEKSLVSVSGKID